MTAMVPVVAGLPGVPESLVGGLASFIAPCTLPLIPGWIALAVSAGDRILPAVAAFCGAIVFHLVVRGIGTDDLYSVLHRLEGVTGAVVICILAVAVFRGSRKPWIPVTAGAVAGLVFGAVWIPCVGRTLGRLLTPQGSTFWRGLLLVVYGIGITLPFVFLTLAALSWDKTASWLRAHRASLAHAGALAFAMLGVALAAGWYRSIASDLARYVVSGA
jgi:cytochrome c-type biogenesis protein